MLQNFFLTGDRGLNLTEIVQDLCNEKYRTLLKEIKEGLSKGKNIPCHGLGDLILLQEQRYPN